MKHLKNQRLTALLLSALLCGSAASALPANAEEPFLLGDLTQDTMVGVDDAVELLTVYAQLAAGLYADLSESWFHSADIDQDEHITVEDAVFVLQYYAQASAGLQPDWDAVLGNSTPPVTDTPSSPDVPTEDPDAPFHTPLMELASAKNAITVRWDKQNAADGFEIYRSTGYSNFTLLAEVGNVTSYVDSDIEPETSYFYKMRAYTMQNGSRVYSEYTDIFSSSDMESILNAAKPLTSHREYLCYNVQGSATTTTTYTISDADVEIMEQFAAEHFTPEMTQGEKLYTVLQWINRNVTYATSASQWNQIGGKSFTEAVFVDKLGQCVQYNGAMTAFMVYLGYDAYLIQGWRGTYPSSYWQHFWCEVNIGGELYIMETGNYGQDGDWSYFLAPYRNTRKYIKNNVNMG